MTQFSDTLFLGAAQTGITTDNNGGVGVGPIAPIYVYDVVPAALAANNVATSQSKASAGTLTLTAGAGVTQTTAPDGTTVYALDCERNIRITSGGNDSGRTFTVTAYDDYWQKLSQVVTGANAGTAATTKAARYLASVSVSGATASNVTVGTGDVFGLPFLLKHKNYATFIKWDGTHIDNTATIVVGDPLPATTTTGDVRGTITPTSASDGSRRLTVGIYLPIATASGPNATRAGALGVNQNLVS